MLGGVLSDAAQLEAEANGQKCVRCYGIREAIRWLCGSQRVSESDLSERTKRPQRGEARSDTCTQLGIRIPPDCDSDASTTERVYTQARSRPTQAIREISGEPGTFSSSPSEPTPKAAMRFKSNAHIALEDRWARHSYCHADNRTLRSEYAGYRRDQRAWEEGGPQSHGGSNENTPPNGSRLSCGPRRP